jgi:hypothetical protein
MSTVAEPSMKLLSKQRDGKKVRCVYDPAKTPLQRLLLSDILPTQKQQELTQVAQTLDPIRLFQQLEQLQQAVFRCAISCAPFVSNTPAAPIRVFSVERCAMGALSVEGMARDPAAALRTLYREQGRRKRVLGWRRTQKDPYAGEWEQVTAWLLVNPERSSGDIFRELQRLSPGRYQPLQIRTDASRDAQNTSPPGSATFEDQWQEEVINGRLPTPVSQAERAERLPSAPDLRFNKPLEYDFR